MGEILNTLLARQFWVEFDPAVRCKPGSGGADHTPLNFILLAAGRKVDLAALIDLRFDDLAAK